MRLQNKAYNVIKYGITIFLPGVGALYFALSEVWDFHRIAGVNGTINALITFGGLLIGYSSRQYNKTGPGSPDGDLIVGTVDGETYVGLGVETSMAALTSKDVVRLKVIDKSATPPAPGVPVVNPANATTPTPIHPVDPPPSS